MAFPFRTGRGFPSRKPPVGWFSWGHYSHSLPTAAASLRGVDENEITLLRQVLAKPRRTGKKLPTYLRGGRIPCGNSGACGLEVPGLGVMAAHLDKLGLGSEIAGDLAHPSTASSPISRDALWMGIRKLRIQQPVSRPGSLLGWHCFTGKTGALLVGRLAGTAVYLVFGRIYLFSNEASPKSRALLSHLTGPCLQSRNLRRLSAQNQKVTTCCWSAGK